MTEWRAPFFFHEPRDTSLQKGEPETHQKDWVSTKAGQVHVYVIGLAEDIMPSFQSKKKGDQSPEMEEERRNCFVAITRTRECLVLSRAESYRGWFKEPSRFLNEMQLAD